MRMKFGIILLMLFGLANAQSECQEKMGAGDPPPDHFCEIFTHAPDTAFFIFTINIIHYPINVAYDSAHMALLTQRSEELFSKYDIRHSNDTAVRWVGIPNNDPSYSYEYMLMTKKTALDIAQEPYILGLVFYKEPPRVSALHAGRPVPIGIFPRRFDLMGRKVPSSRPSRRGTEFLARPD